MPPQKRIKLLGPRVEIRHCEKTPETGSWKEAVSHIREAQIQKIRAQMKARQDVLSEGKQLRSPDHFNKEGILPNSKDFYAIKAGDIRAYCWFSRKESGVLWISHYAYKDSKKLGKDDTAQVIQNWRKHEDH